MQTIQGLSSKYDLSLGSFTLFSVLQCAGKYKSSQLLIMIPLMDKLSTFKKLSRRLIIYSAICSPFQYTPYPQQ